MKKTLVILTSSLLIGIFSVLGTIVYLDYKQKKIQKSDDERLGEFTLLMMDIAGADLSPMRRKVLARTLVRVTGEIFESYSHREAFVGLVAQESRFNANAKSPVGATGLAQLMPQYAPDFAKLCGLNDFKPADLADVELNLYLGACFYRDLLESKLINGNPVAAQTAYNSGQNGESLKNLMAQRAITNLETSNYSTMISYKKEEARRIQDKISKADPSLSASATSQDLQISDDFLEVKNNQLITNFKVVNKSSREPVNGYAVVVATFLTDVGGKIYLTSNNILEKKEIQVSDLIEASKKSAQPFSIKKAKDHQIMIAAPKGQQGKFLEAKIFIVDSKNDSFVLKTLPVQNI